jgi:hypothetical protein
VLGPLADAWAAFRPIVLANCSSPLIDTVGRVRPGRVAGRAMPLKAATEAAAASSAAAQFGGAST